MTGTELQLPLPLALLQASPRLRDTVVMVDAGPRGALAWIDTVASIATIVIALALLLMAVALLLAAMQARKLVGAVRALTDKLQGDTRPILRHVHDAADNLNYISASIRTDVEEFKGTIQSTQARLTRAAEATESRINDFNALLGVVQQEAEQIFVDTASTIRGMKAGANALHQPQRLDWEERGGAAARSDPGDRGDGELGA